MDVTEKMHYIKRELFVIVVFALLVNCLSITINATTASEIPDTHDEFLFCKMGDADFDNRVTAADARIVLRTSVGLQSVTPDRYIYCDCNYDGLVSSADARIVLRTAVGLEEMQEHSFKFSKLSSSNCTVIRRYSAKCSDCGIVVKGVIPANKHVFDSGSLVNTPTITENATKVVCCTLCGYKKNIAVSYCNYFGHKWSTISLKNTPTCEVCKFSDNKHVLSQEEFSEILVGLTSNTKIRNNLVAISENFGSRCYGTYNNRKTAEYIVKKLNAYGFSDNRLVKDKFYLDGIELKNIYATIPTAVKKPDIILLCAHYDSDKKGKGAVDNATGVSSLLEIARILKSTGVDFGCEIRFCFFDAEEIGYYGADRYCLYIKRASKSSAASIKRHKYIINLDMTGKPNMENDYFLCVSTEPVSDRYEYRKAKTNPTSNAIVAAKAIIGDCTETDFYCPVSAGKHDLVPFRENGLTGVTISWREKAETDNECDYNLIPPTIIHTAADTVDNINMMSLYKTTRLVNYAVANVLYTYYCN